MARIVDWAWLDAQNRERQFGRNEEMFGSRTGRAPMPNPGRFNLGGMINIPGFIPPSYMPSGPVVGMTPHAGQLPGAPMRPDDLNPYNPHGLAGGQHDWAAGGTSAGGVSRPGGFTSGLGGVPTQSGGAAGSGAVGPGPASPLFPVPEPGIPGVGSSRFPVPEPGAGPIPSPAPGTFGGTFMPPQARTSGSSVYGQRPGGSQHTIVVRREGGYTGQPLGPDTAGAPSYQSAMNSIANKQQQQGARSPLLDTQRRSGLYGIGGQ